MKLRKIEAENKDEMDEKRKLLKPAIDTPETNGVLAELTGLVKPLSDRIQKLEQQKTDGDRNEHKCTTYVSRGITAWFFRF